MRPAGRTRTGNVVSFIILSYQRWKSYPLFPQNPAETLVELFGSKALTVSGGLRKIKRNEFTNETSRF